MKILLIILGAWLLLGIVVAAAFCFGVSIGRQQRVDEILGVLYDETTDGKHIQYRGTKLE